MQATVTLGQNQQLPETGPTTDSYHAMTLTIGPTSHCLFSIHSQPIVVVLVFGPR